MDTTLPPIVTITPTLASQPLPKATADTSPAAGLPRPEDEPPTLPPLTLELSVDAQPRRVTPGETLTFTINVLHTGYESLQDITLTGILPTGVVFVPQSATNFEYNTKAQALQWRLKELQPGASVTGTFQVRTGSSKRTRSFRLGNTLRRVSPTSMAHAPPGWARPTSPIIACVSVPATVCVRHPRRSRWLDELGRLKGGRSA
jgi:uncharacterized repeat protein (TIGR01451 family)